MEVFQAYPGDSNGSNHAFKGYAGPHGDVISAVSGLQ